MLNLRHYGPRLGLRSHPQVLEQPLDRFPAERWLVIEDNLSTHASRGVKLALLSWPEIQGQFLPNTRAG